MSQEVTALLHGSALEGWTQSYLYDGAGRITQTSYPGCLALCAAPSRALNTNYAFGRPVSVPGFASAITYNPNGTLATINHQNGVVFSQTPDPSGMLRPSALEVTGSTSPWQVESYSYDGAGNIIQIGGKSFIYDADSRVASATVPTAGSLPYQEYTYDAFGNLTQVASGTSPGNLTSSVSYSTYQVNNQLTNRLMGAVYDGSGSVTSYQGSTYFWDTLQQLTDLNTGSETWVHTYDAAGERVWSWRTSPSRLDNYALRGQDGRVLSLFTKTGSAYTWEDYAYRAGRLLGAQFSDGNVTHFDVDHLGSVRLETGGNGPIYRDFWPYGQEATTPTSSERMRFTGHERDLGVISSTADDIDYMHARYYRPLFGRFLSVDRHRGDPQFPESWNKYTYVAGNPLGYVDPDGLVLQAFFLATGTPDDTTRHSAIYFRDDQRGKEMDLVISLGGIESGAHTLNDYLGGYRLGGFPTTAYRLNVSDIQARSLLDSFKRDFVRTTEHSLRIDREYNALTNNCAQYLTRKLVAESSSWDSAYRTLREVTSVVDKVDPTSPVLSTNEGLYLWSS